MGYLPSRALYQVVKPMTEIELNERIDALLSETPTLQKAGKAKPHSREMKVHKDDRLLRIVIRHYIPHAG